MLRDSVRGFLESHWPAEQAVRRSTLSAAVVALWEAWSAQGLTGLGTEPTEGGLQEIAIVMEELGRAACPAPMLGAALVNLGLAGSNEPIARELLTGLQKGSVRCAVAFDGLDAVRGADAVSVNGNHVTGTLRLVDAGLHVSHLLVASKRAAGLLIVPMDHEGVACRPTRAMGGEGWAEVRLEGAAAQFVRMSKPLLADLHRVARIALLARAHGAARRAFELSVEYAKERYQFGQAIGRFQAVQHKLANNLIALEGVRLTLHNAATAFDLGQPAWPYFAAAALAFGTGSLRQVTLETHHVLGAIGYAEEHEAPRHFRRVHMDTIVMGGSRAARDELIQWLLDTDNATLPEYDLGDAGNTFRTTVQQWLQEHWSGARKTAFDRQPFHDREFDASFARDLGATGWLGLGWPVEHGGQARTPREQLAFLEVMERAEAPRVGAGVQANALIMHGTYEQQQRYLPEILRGEAMHGMGYSEPGAGSDLASLRTTAVRDGDHWVINGQKIWTTTWWGKYMFLAARTNKEAKPAHAGISMFIVPMDAPGITIKPSTTMYDGSFANIFYDDVRLPADAIVGPTDGGWKVLTDALANERGLVGGGIVLKVAHAFDLLCSDVREDMSLRTDPLVRDHLGRLAADIEVGRQLMLHCAELAESGTTPPELGAISKVFSSELMERFCETTLDVLGPQAALSQDSPGALRGGRWEQNLRHSLMWVISIGTNEIQRSLIAQRGLGLPR